MFIKKLFQDNLGNHIATQDLDLNNFELKNPSKIKRYTSGNLDIETYFGSISIKANGHLTGINLQNGRVNIGTFDITINNPTTHINTEYLQINIPSKGTNKVLTCIDDYGTCEFRNIQSGNSESVYTFMCSARGQTSGSVSHFYKLDVNGNNSNILSTTSQYEQLQHCNLDPFVAPDDMNLIKLTGCVLHCAVGTDQATNPKLIFNIYKNNYSDRTLKGVFYVPVNSAGVYNDLSQNNYTEFSIDIYVEFNKGETFGIEFVGVPNSNEYCSMIKGCYLNLVGIKRT